MIIRVLTARSDYRARDTPRGEPVTFGIPLPKGCVTKLAGWTLSTPADRGNPSLVQTQVLDRWADGSARWVLVDTFLDSGVGESSEFLIDTAGSLLDPLVAVSIVERNDGLLIDTGGAVFTIQSGPALVASVQVAGVPHLDEAGMALRLTDRTGLERPVLWDRPELETQGTVRSTVLLRGGCALDGRNNLKFIARLHFYAGSAVVRVATTVRNPHAATHKGGFWDLGDPGSLYMKGLSLRAQLAPEAEGLTRRASVSAELGSPLEMFDGPVSIYQDSSGGEAWQSANHINRERRIPVTFRGYRIRSEGQEKAGLRSTPLVSVNDGSTSIAVAVPYFWQNFPLGIEAAPDSLTVNLFPEQFADLHELQGGEQKTHECWFSFGSDAATVVDFARCGTIVSVDPAHVLATEAVPFLAPLNSAHASLLNVATEGPDRFELKREIIDEFGWRHFGDIYGDHESIRQKNPPIVSHYNNQYDPIGGFIYQYLRTADIRWQLMAAELARHVVDIDIYHTDEDWSSYNGGMFWHTYHYGDADTATHRTYPKAGQGRIHGGGPSADHNYTTGLMLQYFLTGEPAFREAVIGLATYVIDLDDGNKTALRFLDSSETGWATVSAGYYGPGRGPANSLNALVDGHRTSGERMFLDKAERILRRVVHPDEDVRRHNLDDPENRWFYTMFLQSVGKYLHYKVELGEVDEAYAYGRASLLNYARWMAANEHPYLDKPERLEFSTETWAAQDIRKSDVFHYAALHAANDERAMFMERGRFFHQYSIRTLASMPTRALARPVIVLLTSGFMDSWMAAHADAGEAAPARSGPFEPQPPFVPQRRRAKQKLTLAAAAGVTFTLLGAAWFFLR